MSTPKSPTIFQTFVRWRPLDANNSPKSTPALQHDLTEQDSKYSISLLPRSNTHRSGAWKSGLSFAHVFAADAINRDVYQHVVAPTLPQVMEGATCNFFAYGHSGSGKTHTIIGYDHEDYEQFGLCLAAAQDLFHKLDQINTSTTSGPTSGKTTQKIGIAIRLYEIRGKCAYDLLNNGIECHIREGADGQTHIRGQTELLEGGKVRVRPIAALPCWKFNELREAVLAGLARRKTGSSSVHDESSRTHAVLELEVVDAHLLEARDSVIERESELVPVGKHATDVYIEEQMKILIRTEEGKYVQDTKAILDQARVDSAEAEKRICEGRVQEAESTVQACFDTSPSACLGGKFVFVDLAGSEYFERSPTGPKQSLQEQKQGRQINTDLFALKEVIRARGLDQSRIPYRASPLTMVLRSHFEGPSAREKGSSAMILTVSSEEAMFVATRNTLKYGGLVGLAGSKGVRK